MRGRNTNGPDRPRDPGWYPDPFSATGEGERYFDGKRWGTTERPLGRHTAASREEPATVHAAARGRRRGVVVALVLVAVVAGLLYVRSRNSSTHQAGAVTTSSNGAPTIPPTNGSSAPGTTAQAASATTGDTGRNGPVCGKYCPYSLRGDWSKLALGDCVDVRTDDATKTFSFTRRACTSTHEAEIYYLARPDTAMQLRPAPKTPAELISRVCGNAVLRSYAPAYAARHGDVALYAGTFGDGDQRVCVVQTDEPRRSLRG